LGPPPPQIRQKANRVGSWVLAKLTGLHLPDTQCGYRLARSSWLRQIIFQSQHYELESEMLVRAAQTGARVISAPIHACYDTVRPSHFKPIIDTWRICRTVVRSL